MRVLGSSSSKSHSKHDCSGAKRLVAFMPFGGMVNDEHRFAILMRNNISGAVSTVLSATKATCFRTKLLCVSPCWMPLQEVLTCIVVTLIGKSIVNPATTHGLFVGFLFSSFENVTRTIIIWTRRISSTVVTGLVSFGLVRPILGLIPSM